MKKTAQERLDEALENIKALVDELGDISCEYNIGTHDYDKVRALRWKIQQAAEHIEEASYA